MGSYNHLQLTSSSCIHVKESDKKIGGLALFSGHVVLTVGSHITALIKLQYKAIKQEFYTFALPLLQHNPIQSASTSAM